MDNNVKIVRMQSGEDIIATVTEHDSEDAVTLGNPMVVIFKRLPTGRAVMMMAPWLPIELVKYNVATIYTADILTIIEPKESMIQYYDTAVGEAQELMEDSDSAVEEALQSKRNDVGSSDFENAMTDESDEEFDDEEDFSDRMESVGKESKKRLLH